ncbi:hypothetical protein D3C76_1314300 [compost metagenome]
MGAIGRVIEHAAELRRPTLQPQLDAPARQHGADLRLAAQPGAHGNRLLRVPRGQVELGGQALVEPAGEGFAKAFGHAANADIRRQREQQGHQRQCQPRQLLAAVGDEPVRQGPATVGRQGLQQQVQAQRQAQGRSQQHGGEQDEAGDQAVTDAQGDQRQHAEHPGEQSLAP